MMPEPKTRPEQTRHPKLWSVQALRWEFYEHSSEYQRLLAKKREKEGVQLGQQIAVIDVEDREFAIAVAHHFLDRYAEEAAGRMSLEVHVFPPEQDLQDETIYQVGDEVLEQARQLGIEGNIKQQVQRMVRDATPHDDPEATRRFGRYIMRLDGNTVTGIGLVDQPRGPRKTK